MPRWSSGRYEHRHDHGRGDIGAAIVTTLLWLTEPGRGPPAGSVHGLAGRLHAHQGSVSRDGDVVSARPVRLPARKTAAAAAKPPIHLSWVAAGWALFYAAYRGYYALGGTVGMFGVPVDDGTWRLVNASAVVPLLGAAVLPVVALRVWHRRTWRRVLLGVGWVIAVGCVMHGIIDEVTHLLSLAGRLELTYPAGFWVTVDRHAANLQDLLFNEPWFIGEGLLWAAIAWWVLGPGRERRAWMGSAAVAVVALVAIGLLSAFGVMGRFVVF